MTTFRCSPPGVDIRRKPWVVSASGRRQWADHSEYVLKVLPRDFAISENLGKQAAPYGLPTMNGNHGTSPVGMPKKMMAALCADNLEAELPKGLDEVGPCDRRQLAHSATATR